MKHYHAHTRPVISIGEHLHLGQKVANFFRKGGLPDWITLMLISAMPGKDE